VEKNENKEEHVFGVCELHAGRKERMGRENREVQRIRENPKRLNFPRLLLLL
jgi:hypothetical protein